MNGGKVIENLTHASIIASMAYFATHPDSPYLWLVPAISWLGQCMDAPDITMKDVTPVSKVAPKKLPVVEIAPEVPHA